MSIFLLSERKRDVIRYAPTIYTAEYQPAEVDGLDTFIYSVSPTTNFGTDTVLNVTTSANPLHTLIKCPNFSWIPNREVTSFYLHLYTATSTTNSDISIYKLLRNWVENQATWNVYSTGNSWTTAGGTSDGNDKEAITQATFSCSSVEASGFEHKIQLPLTLLSDWQTGSNYGLILINGSGQFFTFHSSNSATPAYYPKWSVDYI